MHEADSGKWSEVFEQIHRCGYDGFELSSAWISYPVMSARRLEELRARIDASGLKVLATSVVRRSVIHPSRGEENLEYTRQAIAATRMLGVDLICLGLHDELRPDQHAAEWFWTPGNPPPDDSVRPVAVSRMRELARDAAAVDVDISLELYEDTFLGASDGAVAFIEDVAAPNVGLNPDIGNLVRRLGPVESWEQIGARTLPHANYWHVKNIMRAQTGAGDIVTFPVPLAQGIINYRTLVDLALANGFSGPIIVEHYGGDGLGVGAINREYLFDLFRQATG